MPDQPQTMPDATTLPPSRGEIVVLNRDLMFGIQIGNVLRAAGFRATSTSTTPTFVDRLRDPEAAAVLGIINMVALVDWDLVADVMAGDSPTPVLAFGPHVNVPLWRSARAAGVTRVVSNGYFHRDMLSLVERYARLASPEPDPSPP